MTNPTVRDVKAYVPSKNFELSQRFYRDLGFELTEVWGGNFDCKLGNAVFRLQNYYVKEFAENMMLQFEVDDARSWYQHAEQVINGNPDYEPARVHSLQEYGDVLIANVIDPSGVLLIFLQG
jgi:hypothetical protein